MKTYLYIIKTRIQTMLAYRIDMWVYIVLQCLMMVAVGFFWNSVYGDTETAHDVTRSGMITYTVISSLMSSIYYMGVEDRLTDAIRSGSIATDMIKPLNLFTLYFFEDIGNIIVNFFRTTIPIFLIGLLVFGLPEAASGAHLALFFLSFVLGYGINWSFSAMFAMIAFKAINLGPLFSVKYHFVNLLSGAMIPIWFFPDWLQAIVQCLPFVYMYQTPLNIFIGKLSVDEALSAVGIQAIWLAVLFVLFFFAQRRALKHVLVQGG